MKFNFIQHQFSPLILWNYALKTLKTSSIINSKLKFDQTSSSKMDAIRDFFCPNEKYMYLHKIFKKHSLAPTFDMGNYT